MTKNKAFIIEPDSQVTYINQITNEKWQKWKSYKECTEKEKQQINLASYPSNTILFDRDLPDKTEQEIMKDYENFKKRLIHTQRIKFFYSYRSPKGYHVIAPFKRLEKYSSDMQKEIRKYYVSLTSSDPAKISDRGVVSLPGKPHFKNNVVYDIFEHHEGLNDIPHSILMICRKRVRENKETIIKLNIDKDFENYFENDKFFDYIKNNIIPDGTMRDLEIFPNLAIAATKSGKTKKEIDEILKPIINKNFPGKVYAEFEGWYKKAVDQQIKDYNPIQLNNWMKKFSTNKLEIYDLESIKIDKDLKELTPETKDKKQFYWDSELNQLGSTKIEWLIDKWVPVGDVCFVAGKASSFKSTICLHWGYAISTGKLVFNKYPTKTSKVLYLNEENSRHIIKSMIDRVKNGLSINNSSDQLAISVLENFRLDELGHIELIINFIKKHDIKVLICDSLRRFIGFDENDATRMNEFFQYIKRIKQNCPELTVIILHHLKKSNSRYSTDLRDELRGSSDIVNSADSVILIRRPIRTNNIFISHIKNRSGEELQEKLIKHDIGEDKDMSYFYEDSKDISKHLTLVEQCANVIMNYVEENKLTEFSKVELEEKIAKNFTNSTIKRSLKLLESEGTLTSIGSTSDRKYFIN